MTFLNYLIFSTDFWGIVLESLGRCRKSEHRYYLDCSGHKKRMEKRLFYVSMVKRLALKWPVKLIHVYGQINRGIYLAA